MSLKALRPLLVLTLVVSLAPALFAGPPEFVFVRGDRTPVSKLAEPLRTLVRSLDTGTVREHDAVVKTLRESLATLEGGRYYADRAESVYGEFDRSDVMSLVREYALWNRFVKDCPTAAARAPFVYARWLVALDRIQTVTGFEEAMAHCTAVTEALAQPSNDLEKRILEAARINAIALSNAGGTSGR